MIEWLRFAVCAALMLAGLFMMITSIIGVYRFKYVMNRMHSAAIGDTMGIMLIILGLIVASGFNLTSLKLLLLIIIWWLTSPVSSHLIGRLEITTNPRLEEKMRIVDKQDQDKESEC